MLEITFLQAEAGAVIIIAVLAAVIISTIFYGIQRKGISSIRERMSVLAQIDPKIQYDVSRMQTEMQTVYTDLNNLRTELPHTTEVAAVQENVKNLCGDFTVLRTTLEDQMNKFRLITAEDMNKTRNEMIKTATEKLVENANNHLIETSVTRDEFDDLKKHVEKVLGAEEVAERMEILSSIFESKSLQTLNWQCKLIKLLNGGLAPDAEEELLASHAIPRTRYEDFLKKLTESGISEQKEITAYYLVPEFEWIYSYVEKPDWLQKRLMGTIKKEKEYQQYIREHLELVEEGLLLEKTEYVLASGPIDFICRDSNGRAVGLELKYPDASNRDIRQISGYKKEYEEKTGTTNSRFILIAPKIPEKLKLSLVNDGFEYKEIPF